MLIEILKHIVIEISLEEYGSYAPPELVNRCKNGKLFLKPVVDDVTTRGLQKRCQNVAKLNKPKMIQKLSEGIKRKKCLQTLYEFRILFQRTVKILTRDKSLTHLRIMTHLVTGLFIGLIYFRIGNNARFVMDNFNFLFFTVMFLMLTAFNSMALTCNVINRLTISLSQAP